MIESIGGLFNRLAQRFMPHPFVFALLLTLVTFVLGLVWAGESVGALFTQWASGAFTPALLTFMLQMCLILVTGHALASTGPVRRALGSLASIPRGTRSAVVVTALTAMAAGFLNWGLGLIAGALLAREVARSAAARGVRVHYPLVVAAGYTGLLVWHGGFSGSAPLSVATPDHFLQAQTGVIPVSATLLSPLNLAVSAALLIAVPAILALMAPREPAPPPPPESLGRATPAPSPAPPARPTPAQRLDRSRLLALVGVVLGAAHLIARFGAEGLAALGLNTLILFFLVLGLLLHGTPARYARAIDEATPGVSGILLQFPFYFGIMGIMKGSGLVGLLAQSFVRASESFAGAGIPVAASYSVMTYLAAGVINVFVPSGGGQWAVQGPIAVEACARLGVPIERAILAIAYGDELTNMLQPFWALPLLAITGLSARDIVGYCALLMFLVAPIVVVLLALLA